MAGELHVRRGRARPRGALAAAALRVDPYAEWAWLARAAALVALQRPDEARDELLISRAECRVRFNAPRSSGVVFESASGGPALG